MKDYLDEEDGLTYVLYPNAQTLLYSSKHQNRLAGRWEVKSNESVFKADHKNSSC